MLMSLNDGMGYPPHRFRLVRFLWLALFCGALAILVDRNLVMHLPDYNARGRRRSISAPIRTAVVHIGPYKTASTTIQHDLCKVNLKNTNWTVPVCPACQTCRPPHSVVKFWSGHRNSTSRADFTCGLPPEDQEDCFIRALTATPAHHNVIFSSERFAGLSPKGILRMNRTLRAAGFNHIEVVYYHRNHAERIFSSCNQKIKSTGEPSSYERIVLEQIAKPLPTKLLDEYARVADRLTMISFDRIHEAGIHPFQALLDTQPSLRSVKFQSETHSNPGIHHLAAQLFGPVMSNLQQPNTTTTSSQKFRFCFLKNLNKYVVERVEAFPTWCLDTKKALDQRLQDAYEWCQRTPLLHRSQFECADFLRQPTNHTWCFVDEVKFWAHPPDDFWEWLNQIRASCDAKVAG